MTKHALKSIKRDILGHKVKTLRKQGILPASLFGKDIKSQNLSLILKDFSKVYTQVGESGLVYLTVGEGKTETPVIFSEVARHPVSGDFLHVSLRQVSLTEKITAPVKIELTGKSQAIADGIGVLVQQADEIEVEALPQDFPDNITVDISELNEVDSAILVKDLKLSSKLTVISPSDTILVKINPLAKEEVEAAPIVTEVITAAAPTEKVEPAAEEKK